VDGQGEFLTQRELPQLGHVIVEFDGDDLCLRSARAGEVRVPLEPEQRRKRERVHIWRDIVLAEDCGAEAAEFFTAHLGRDVRLVHMPESTHRQANLEFAAVGDRVSFADGYPILLIGEASLTELNARLETSLPMMRFRPNVVVSTTVPHEEDTWRRIVLGDIACDVVKPCARCPVPTIDEATLEFGKEPLRTFATYRRWHNKVWFGQNVIHRAEGTLHVGDTVEVLTTGLARPPLELARVSRM
jgi:uncharacterized protein